MTGDVKIMVLAGEPSGDIHGSHLCRELRDLYPGVNIFGMGGEEMEKSGVELVQRIGRTGVVGFWEVFKDIGRYRKIFKRLVAIMEERSPDAVILIDYPGFNIRFARRAHNQGIKVIYYISPQLWAWGRWRVKKIRRSVDKMVVIFPFEKDFYANYGVDAVFVGHPLVGNLNLSLGKEECRRRLGIEGSPVIGLLPGSRKSEVEKILPVLLKTAGILREHLSEAVLLLPVASPALRPLVEEIVRLSPVEINLLEERGQEILAASDLLILASGTVTLEAAVFATPMIIVYRLNFFSWISARLLVTLPYIGLVNIVAGKKIVPEFIQYQARPARIARVALKILGRPEIREEMIRELALASEKLGKPGAGRRAAREILQIIIPDYSSRIRDE